MAIDPIRIAGELDGRFRRYLRTTFDFPDRDAALGEQFAEALAQPERLFKGPYLHGLAPYVTDVSISDLVREGVFPAAAADLPLLPSKTRPLYAHQVQAIRRLMAGRNVVVSSGTGSGKTLSFLAPILAGILADPQPGVHALLLYPMNALVNDQLKTLRKVLGNHPTIRFGRYINKEVTPDKESEGRRKHPHAPANEVVSREAFRRQPPHLLITNYSMLEYLLLRADDSPLFHGPWRYVVVDEAHTYGGTKGGEVALLLRRLRARVKSGDVKPQYIATSASLGTDDPARRQEVLSFARTLFDADFDDADLISAQKDHTPASGGCTPAPAIYVHPALAAVLEGRGKWTPALGDAFREAGFPVAAVAEAERLAAIDIAEALFAVFSEDARALALRDAAGKPTDLREAAHAVFGSDDEETLRQLCGLVQACSMAKVPGSDARLVPCRYHLFARGLSGAWVALTPGETGPVAELFLDPTRDTDDGRKALELRMCRKCGQPYLVGRTHDDGGHTALVQGDARDWDGHRGDGWAWSTWASPQAESEDDGDEAAADVPDFPEYRFNTKTGKYGPRGDAPLGKNEVGLWQVHEGKELTKCVGCGGKNGVTPIQADSDGSDSCFGLISGQFQGVFQFETH